MEYSPAVRRYFEAPELAGDLVGHDGFCVAGCAGQERTGMRIWLAVRVTGGRVAEACFRAYGCPHTIAVAARLAEQMRGASVSELTVDPLALADMLELPAEKLDRALCGEDALISLRENWSAAARSERADGRLTTE